MRDREDEGALVVAFGVGTSLSVVSWGVLRAMRSGRRVAPPTVLSVVPRPARQLKGESS